MHAEPRGFALRPRRRGLGLHLRPAAIGLDPVLHPSFKNNARGAEAGAPSAAHDLECSRSVGVGHELNQVVGDGGLSGKLRSRGRRLVPRRRHRQQKHAAV